MKMVTRRWMLRGAAASALPAERPPFADGQTITVSGREIFLTDIVAPSPTSLRGTVDQAAQEAAIGLQQLLDQGLIAVPSSGPTDRWGRAIGPVSFHNTDGAKTTLQEALLLRGWARVFPQSDNHDFLDRCFAAEDSARALRLGLWAHSAYQVRDAHDLRRAIGLQIYRGTVVNAVEGRERIYINFGDDFRTDLTATVRRGDFRRWRSKEPVHYYGRRQMEVRGLVESINGPSIELRHERQLRLI